MGKIWGDIAILLYCYIVILLYCYITILLRVNGLPGAYFNPLRI